MAIRSYGPGKFNTILDGYAYDVTLDGGADEEASYDEGGGWYGLLRLNQATRDRVHQSAHYNEDDLTDEESDLLDDSVAIIFFERSDGIVEVDWFDNAKQADTQWAKIEAEFEDDEDDEDGEETVYDYDTNEALEGAPSEELIEQSDSASPTGAVPAYRDDDGVWQYVAPSEVEHYRRNLRIETRTVYTQGDE